MSERMVTIYIEAFAEGFAEFERRQQEKPAPKDYAFVYGLATYLRAVAKSGMPLIAMERKT